VISQALNERLKPVKALLVARTQLASGFTQQVRR
jgi:hypothetical protein